MVHIGNDWDELLSGEFEQEYYQKLRSFLAQEYAQHTVYPDMYSIFNALKYCSREDTKVLILGQDPYHEPNQAHGLCFSVQNGVALPPSLQNIYKELSTEYGCEMPTGGDLTGWAKQGVLLLNTTLTVRAGCPMSHAGKGWELLTDRVIDLLNEKETPVVFLLWGNHARSKKVRITNPRHLILETVHPSPLSAHRGFFGCNHFRLANDFLERNGEKPILWVKSQQ